MSKENTDLIYRWFEEVWNQGKEETIDELFAPQGEVYGLTQEMAKGPEDFRAFWKMFHSGFDRIHIQIEDVIHGDSKIVARWTGKARHAGEFMGYAATQMDVTFTGMTICVCDRGKLFDSWNNWDCHGLLEQIRNAK